MPNPGKRKAQISRQPHVRAARLRDCGSGAAEAAAASEGGVAEVDNEDALARTDETQHQLEAAAVEMNAELNANLGDAQVVCPYCPRLMPVLCLIRLCRLFAQMGAQRGRRTSGGGWTRGGSGRPEVENEGKERSPGVAGGCGPSRRSWSFWIHLLSICLMLLQVYLEGEHSAPALATRAASSHSAATISTTAFAAASNAFTAPASISAASVAPSPSAFGRSTIAAAAAFALSASAPAVATSTDPTSALAPSTDPTATCAAAAASASAVSSSTAAVASSALAPAPDSPSAISSAAYAPPAFS